MLISLSFSDTHNMPRVTRVIGRDLERCDEHGAAIQTSYELLVAYPGEPGSFQGVRFGTELDYGHQSP